MTQTSQTDASKLNPKCRKIMVGIRELHEIILYPVSAAGYLKMKDAIKEIFDASQRISMVQASDQFEGAPLKNFLTADIIAQALETNAAILFTEATCGDIPGEDLLKEIDAEQTVMLLDTIFEMNFMGLKDTLPLISKKWMEVFTKAPTLTEVKLADGKSV